MVGQFALIIILFVRLNRVETLLRRILGGGWKGGR